ncbi:hypothetical protein F66182_8233 [Fusarium sp. NRRL 66182]|nr:hypothetical protein F66182_8233 [Fusarium sp. NRRL 66182]
MSNAAVTSYMRTYGWNVYLLANSNAFHFAGVYQHHENPLLTFNDLVDELKLCFELPDAKESSWDDIAFGLVKRGQDVARFSAFVAETDLDETVPSLPCNDPQERAVVRYHIVRHKDCRLPTGSTLQDHLEANCAKHIPRPVRRCEPRYLPPKKASEDARIARMPFRRTRKARTASVSPKRDSSGSASPDKDGQEEAENVNAMITPAAVEEINRAFAQRTFESFRSSVLISAKRCAVSKKGQSWCVNPGIGPALQACHIVPQQHYHVYPDSSNSEDTMDSTRRLREAWLSTWAPTNGILMMSHIHEFFDSRLFSIHPETLRIRAFVPYDAILDYHGSEANVPESVDREALRHHYEMCCIENMAAKMPPEELVLAMSTKAATSGTSSPFTSRNDLPATPGQDGRIGDPSERPRTTQERLDDGPGGSQMPEQGHENLYAMDMREHKRQRVNEVKVEDIDWIHDGILDSYITPMNSRQFLADVNWELGKLTNHNR